MLRELYIRNLAVVKELRLPLGPGLTVLTGETGAGKSLLVDALLLALGERASQEMLRAGAQSATVEALFEGTHPLLQELGIEAPEGQMLLRRVLQAGGRSRAFINDISVSLQSLQQLGASLVDIHGQHEHQSLLSPSSQLALLDAVAGAEDSRQGLSRLHQELRVLRERLQELKDKARRRQEREEVLRFQLQEIQAAALRTGEEEELLRQQEILKHLSRLKELLEEAYALMYSSEGSALEALKRAGAALKEASRVDSSASSALGLLQEALPLVEEAALALRGLRQQYELEPQSLDAVQERLYLIQRLKAKYGPSIEDILRYAQRAEEELQGLGGASGGASGPEEVPCGKGGGLPGPLQGALGPEEEGGQAATGRAAAGASGAGPAEGPLRRTAQGGRARALRGGPGGIPLQRQPRGATQGPQQSGLGRRAQPAHAGHKGLQPALGRARAGV